MGLFGRSSFDEDVGFDEATLTLPDGSLRRLSKAQFDALPLGERIRSILDKSLKFYRKGQEIPMKQALGDR